MRGFPELLALRLSTEPWDDMLLYVVTDVFCSKDETTFLRLVNDVMLGLLPCTSLCLAPEALPEPVPALSCFRDPFTNWFYHKKQPR
jgi:hypothetical protein